MNLLSSYWKRWLPRVQTAIINPPGPGAYEPPGRLTAWKQTRRHVHHYMHTRTEGSHTFLEPETLKLCGVLLRAISLLISFLLRFVDSTFLWNSLWAWEFHPLSLRLRLIQTLRNPESRYGDWPWLNLAVGAKGQMGSSLMVSLQI